VTETSRFSAVEWIEIDSIQPNPENPRFITDERFEALRKSLREDPDYMEARPLIVRRGSAIIVGGNMRWRAAQAEDWPRVPIVWADLTDADAATIALRDNASYGEWDDNLLSEMVSKLGEMDVDLDLTGLPEYEVERLLDDAGWSRDTKPKDDEAPPLPVGIPDSKEGEVYQLGPHLLVCGDATDVTSYNATLLPEPRLLWTDPPYGVAYKGGAKPRIPLVGDERDGETFALLVDSFKAAEKVLEPGSPYYLMKPAGRPGIAFELAVLEAGWAYHQSLVWVKQSIVPGYSDYHFRHEDILYGWMPGEGSGPQRMRKEHSHWYGGHAAGSVLEYPRPITSPEHPTMKPVDLVRACISNSSQKGDVVLDPFAGSGTTMIAADLDGRVAWLVEKDPAYCDVVRERWARYVAEKET
jgi:DNA modification methylase